MLSHINLPTRYNLTLSVISMHIIAFCCQVFMLKTSSMCLCEIPILTYQIQWRSYMGPEGAMPPQSSKTILICKETLSRCANGPYKFETGGFGVMYKGILAKEMLG